MVVAQVSRLPRSGKAAVYLGLLILELQSMQGLADILVRDIWSSLHEFQDDRRLPVGPVDLLDARKILRREVRCRPGKGNKQIERCLISSFRVAESVGFKGNGNTLRGSLIVASFELHLRGYPPLCSLFTPTVERLRNPALQRSLPATIDSRRTALSETSTSLRRKVRMAPGELLRILRVALHYFGL